MGVIDNLKKIVKNFADQGTTTDKPDFGEIGYGHDSVWNAYLDEEKTTDSIKIEDYIKMQENDGEVQGLIRLLTTPIISTGWEIVAPDGNEDSEELKFIKENFEGQPNQGGMDTPLQLIISDMTRAFAEGFRLYEKVWELRNGKIYLKKLAIRDAKTITLQADEHGEYKGAVQRITGRGQFNEVIIPAYKTLLYTFQKEKDWLYGRSILKAAYYHYDKKHKLYYIAHKAAELQTVPPKIIKITNGMSDADKAKLENAIDRIGVNTRVSIPKDNVELDTFEYKGTSTVNIKDLIDHHNSQMLKSALAQMSNLGSEGKSSGSYALSQTLSDYCLMGIEAEMKNMASHLNWYVIPQLIDWNFGTGVYPQIRFNPIKDSVKELLQEVFKSLITGKSTVIPDIFYKSILNKTSESLNLGISEQDIDKGMEEKKAETEAKAKAIQDNITKNKDGSGNNDNNNGKDNGDKKFADIPVNKYGRELRPEETKINLEDIETVMDNSEATMKSEIQKMYFSEKLVILEQIKKAVETKDPSLLNELIKKLKTAYAKVIYEQSIIVAEAGLKSAAKELGVEATSLSQEKLDLFQSTADTIAQKEINDLIWIGQQEVMAAIKNPSISPTNVMNVVSPKLDEKFSYNLDLTASIQTTSALNDGRDDIFKLNLDKVYAFEYSAILDKKTCKKCEALDGSVIAVNDPAYFKYRPPIHEHCRCIWVAINKSEINKPPITGIKLQGEANIGLSDIDSFIPYIQQIEQIKNKKDKTQDDLDKAKQIYDVMPDKYKVYVKETIGEINDEPNDMRVVGLIKRLEEIRAIEHPSELDLQEVNDILAVLPSNLRYTAEEVISQVETKLRNGQ